VEAWGAVAEGGGGGDGAGAVPLFDKNMTVANSKLENINRNIDA
jgi:hypothetical protein